MGIKLLETGAVRIGLGRQVNAGGAVVADIIWDPVGVFAVGGVIRLVLHIAIQVGARVNQFVIAKFTFKAPGCLDELLVSEIREKALDIVIAYIIRIMIPGALCFHILVNHACVSHPVFIEVHPQCCPQSALGQLIEIIFDQAVIIYGVGSAIGGGGIISFVVAVPAFQLVGSRTCDVVDIAAFFYIPCNQPDCCPLAQGYIDETLK